MKKYIKDVLKHIPVILMLLILLYVISTQAATILLASNEVSYSNTNTDIQSGDVQGAIEELHACTNGMNTYSQNLRNFVNNYILDIYPVGSIYMSTIDSTASAVSARFGGRWEAFAKGKTLVGIDPNDSDFDTVNKTGGQAITLLTADNIPSHDHSIPSLTGTAQSNGAHTHNITSVNGLLYGDYNGGTGGATHRIMKSSDKGNVANAWYCASNGAHTHSVTTTATTTPYTGSGIVYGADGVLVTGYTGEFPTIDDFAIVYMWKRVA